MVSGSSTLTLQTNNTYSGGTTISNAAATVDVGGGGTSGQLGTGDVNNSGTLKFTRTDGNALTPVTFVNNINGTGNLFNSCPGATIMSGNISQASVTVNGGGTTTLSGSVTASGAVSISGNSTSATLSGAVSTGTGFTVSGTANATASGGINGAGGVTLNGTGFLTVGGSSGYSGNTVINSGTFFTNDASALGDHTGATTVSSPGSLYVVAQNANYGSEVVTINGTGTANNGALHAGGSTTSTFENTVTLGSDSLINLDGGATLAFTGVTNGTALNGGNHVLSLSGGGALVLGSFINVTSFNTGTTNSTLAFAPTTTGSTTSISTPITGAGIIRSDTGGTPAQGTVATIKLTNNNTSFTGGLATGSGNFLITDLAQVGNTTGRITFNGGAGLVYGALQLAPTSGSFAFSNPLTFVGRDQATPNVPDIQNLSGNNTFSGAITVNTGGNNYTLQSDAGTLTIQSGFSTAGLGLFSSRSLNLQSAGNGVLNGALADTPNPATGNPLTLAKSGSGTWTLGASSTLNGDLILNDSGTLAIGAGKSVTFTTGTLNVATAGATPHVSFGATGTDVGTNLTINNMSFADTNARLKIDNWTYGVGANGDHLLDNGSPLDTNMLKSQVQFADFHLGAQMVTVATAARSIGEIIPTVGDVNQDGVVNAADVSALMSGLTNIAGFQSARALTSPSSVFTASDAKFLLDVNGDGVDTNADVQAEISLIATIAAGGTGVTNPVPEPASFVLLALGGLTMAAMRFRSSKREL